MKKTVLALLLAAAALMLGSTPSRVGAAPSRQPHGVVSHFSHGVVPRTAARTSPRAAGPQCGGADCSSYESAINKYFTDVATDSGTGNNVYSVDTQYSDGTGPIAYASTFNSTANVYVDTNPYPANSCNDTYLGNSDSVCLDDAQLQQEILNDINANSWPKDTTAPTHLYFIFTPSDVGICFDPGSASDPITPDQCSTNVFCAYHDNFLAAGGTDIAYAVEPDNATIPGGGCDSGQEPNDPGSDPTINTTSHEMNEAITDPWPETSGGWWSNDGNEDEIGDLCAWGFGSTSGTTGSEYNQTINGDNYFLQQEYSNAASGCVQHLGGTASPTTIGSGPLAYQNGSVMRTNTIYAIYWVPTSSLPATPTNSAAPIVAGVAAVGKTLSTSNGGWTGSPATYAYQWQQCSAIGTSCSNISGADSSLYVLGAGDAGHEIRAEVSAHNSGGWSSATPSVASEVVVPVPAASVAPAVSGVAAVGQTLSTTQGSWNTPASYTYQWLRCTGTNCSSIGGATSSTYIAGSADEGHTLEALVYATNAAATTSATSTPTASVIGLPVATKLPHISGQAKVGKKLSAGKGTWSGPPESYSYQWFRCSAKGKSCVHIAGAAKSTYKLTKKDAKHRLRVRVTASNIAGSHPAFSATSREVPAVKKHR